MSEERKVVRDVLIALDKAEALADKIEEVGLNQDFIGVFAFSQAHGYNYQGPTWGQELEEFREAIRRIREN